MTPDSTALAIACGLLVVGAHVWAQTSGTRRRLARLAKSAKLADLPPPPYRIEPPRVIARRVVETDREAAAIAALADARRRAMGAGQVC